MQNIQKCHVQEVQKAKKKNILYANKKLSGQIVKGYDFNEGVNYEKMFTNYATTGLQASNLSSAINIVNKMLNWRLSDEPLTQKDDEQTSSPTYRSGVHCKIFLGYTSNMVSCGIREIIRYLAEHRMIDCIVTTTGGIEEDLMKTMATFHMASFTMDDKQNRVDGHCRIGNILVPNDNYVRLEQFLLPLFKQLSQEQQKGQLWTPSSIIARFGKQINDQSSIYYWCWKNNIPVFCPGFTDGAIGDILFTNSFKNDLRIDIVQDIKKLSMMTIKAQKSGVIILGGSIPKHHIMNAHIWRNGADYGVFINTAEYYDGSDSGAKIQEAYTWGKLRLNAQFSKIHCEASLVFPILVANTFAKQNNRACKKSEKNQDKLE